MLSQTCSEWHIKMWYRELREMLGQIPRERRTHLVRNISAEHAKNRTNMLKSDGCLKSVVATVYTPSAIMMKRPSMCDQMLTVCSVKK